jgi:hypothetical protein
MRFDCDNLEPGVFLRDPAIAAKTEIDHAIQVLTELMDKMKLGQSITVTRQRTGWTVSWQEKVE